MYVQVVWTSLKECCNSIALRSAMLLQHSLRLVHTTCTYRTGQTYLSHEPAFSLRAPLAQQQEHRLWNGGVTARKTVEIRTPPLRIAVQDGHVMSDCCC